MLLYYVRHGDPIYNPDCLTPLGKRQAEAVGKRIATFGVDKIFASTSQRAYETAIPLSELCKKEITRLEFLEEGNAWRYFTAPSEEGFNTWVYQNRQMRTLFLSDEIYRLGSRWYEHPALAGYPFGEGVEFFRRHTDELLLSLGYAHDRETHTYRTVGETVKRVAIFAHEGVGSIFLSSLLDIPYPIFAAHYLMSHTGVTVLRFEDEGEGIIPRLLSFSNDAHIYKEDLPRNYCGGDPI